MSDPERVISDIARTRRYIPIMTEVMRELREQIPELADHDRIGVFVAELQRQAGSLEMAILIAVLVDDLVDRQEAP